MTCVMSSHTHQGLFLETCSARSSAHSLAKVSALSVNTERAGSEQRSRCRIRVIRPIHVIRLTVRAETRPVPAHKRDNVSGNDSERRDPKMGFETASGAETPTRGEVGSGQRLRQDVLGLCFAPGAHLVAQLGAFRGNDLHSQYACIRGAPLPNGERADRNAGGHLHHGE